jgi:hypothetical protein
MHKFLSGPVSFVRFARTGPKPGAFGDDHLERLRDRHVNWHTLATADGVNVGWSAGEHILDTEFALDKNVYPEHLLFDICKQTDKLPADKLKAYYSADLHALAKDNPSGFASARQKREAKESARARLEEEARDGRFRKWQTVPCAWDAVTNRVFLGSASPNVADRFQRLWAESFDANLIHQKKLGGHVEPLTAGLLAAELLAHVDFEQLELTTFAGSAFEGAAWCTNETRNWLGNEFLLWLWFTTDTSTDTITLPDGSEATFMFAGGIKVEDPRGVGGNGTMNSDSAVRLPEARAAVATGKLPRKAALCVVRNGDQFTFTLQAETLAVGGAKFAKPDATGREAHYARLQQIRDLAETLDLMFGAFLAVRVGDQWEAAAADMRAWLKGGARRAAA